MKLETSARWRGIVAAVSCVLWIFFLYRLGLNTHDELARTLCGMFGLIAMVTAVGWFRRRRQMQRLDYHARAIGRAVRG